MKATRPMVGASGSDDRSSMPAISNRESGGAELLRTGPMGKSGEGARAGLRGGVPLRLRLRRTRRPPPPGWPPGPGPGPGPPPRPPPPPPPPCPRPPPRPRGCRCAWLMRGHCGRGRGPYSSHVEVLSSQRPRRRVTTMATLRARCTMRVHRWHKMVRSTPNSTASTTVPRPYPWAMYAACS